MPGLASDPVLDVGAVDNDFAHRDIGRQDFAVAVHNHSAMRRDGEADGMFLRGEIGILSCLTTCSSMRRAENPVKMIPTTPLAIMPVGRPSISRTKPLVGRCAHSAALVSRDGLSNPSDVVILNRLQGDQALIKLALELGPRGKGGNPGQQHFVLCTNVADLAFYFARLFAKEVLLFLIKTKGDRMPRQTKRAAAT